jgi:hypothetical protein
MIGLFYLATMLPAVGISWELARKCLIDTFSTRTQTIRFHSVGDFAATNV